MLTSTKTFKIKQKSLVWGKQGSQHEKLKSRSQGFNSRAFYAHFFRLVIFLFQGSLYDIPIISLDWKQTRKLKKVLMNESNLSVHVVVTWNFKPPKTVTETVQEEVRVIFQLKEVRRDKI